jgi:hydrogenase/urease accessory protein HupE
MVNAIFAHEIPTLGRVDSLLEGSLHLVSGFGHWVVVLLVCLASLRIGGRYVWALSSSLAVGWVFGGIAGASGYALLAPELTVAVLLAPVGLAIWRPRRFDPNGTLLASGIAGAAYGNSHALSAPHEVAVQPFTFGLVFALVGMQIAGMALLLAVRLMSRVRDRGGAGRRPVLRPRFGGGNRLRV